MLWFLLGLLLGFLIGMIIGSIIIILIYFGQTSMGALKINYTDPEKDVYRIHIDDLVGVEKKKRVMLKVINESDDSQN